MKLTNISLPYPVLGINDDVLPLLQDDCITLQPPIADDKEFTFTVELKHQNEEIERLISIGMAEYVCEVNCVKTYLRKCICSTAPSFDVKLNRKDVAGKIEFSCFVTAKENVKSYCNGGFHSDYDGFTFNIEIGEVLVVFPSAVYNFDIKYDKLYAAGSFMQITQGSKDCTVTWFDLEGDKILIVLPPPMYEQYQKVYNNTNFMEIFHASIVFNALVHSLYRIEDEDYKDKLWAESIRYIVESNENIRTKGIDLSDKSKMYELAQHLLDDPYSRLFKCLNNINESNLEEEE